MKHLYDFKDSLAYLCGYKIRNATSLFCGGRDNEKHPDSGKIYILDDGVMKSDKPSISQNEFSLTKYSAESLISKHSKKSIKPSKSKLDNHKEATLSQMTSKMYISNMEKSTKPSKIENEEVKNYSETNCTSSTKSGRNHSNSSASSSILSVKQTEDMNVKGLLREIKRFFQESIPFAKTISKMNANELIESCIQFLDHLNFGALEKSLYDKLFSQESWLESSSLFVQSSDLIDLEASYIKLNFKEYLYDEDFKTSLGIYLALFLNPQKLFKLDPKNAISCEYADKLEIVKESSLVINDVIFECKTTRLQR